MSLSNILVKNLRKSYPQSPTILDIASLEFRAGELTCVLGSTGCGKTTLLNILAGVDLDFEGEVVHMGSTQPRVSYQLQKDLLLPWKNIHDNLIFGFIASGKKPSYDLADDWLRDLDLQRVAQAYPYTLSTGMRQRVALGRALVWDGDLKLLDEPLSSQDFTRRLMLEALLRDVLRRKDTISVVVTHNLEEAVVLADRIIILGGQPARILDDFQVTGLSDKNRPVSARRAPEFAQYVGRAAKALSDASVIT